MSAGVENILVGGEIDLERLWALGEAPPPWTPGEEAFWTDPHIARQMLATHLDPDTDLASRRPEIIAQSVAWIVQELQLQAGAAILDLGCGPGLYAARLAGLGYRITGVDFSQNSIDYADRYALEHHFDINYRCQDYLTLTDESAFEAALLIYGDFCPLSAEQRRRLLANVRRALKPGGRFILDVSRHKPAQVNPAQTGWHVSQGGFWRPGAHLVLEHAFSYPELALQMDQYAVVEATGALSVYRIWRQEYTPQSIIAELKAGKFETAGVWGDLAGLPDSEEADWIGIVAVRMD